MGVGEGTGGEPKEDDAGPAAPVVLATATNEGLSLEHLLPHLLEFVDDAEAGLDRGVC